MPTLILALMACSWMAFASAIDLGVPADTRGTTSAEATASDSSQMETDLQQLPWEQFRFIIEAVPKLKAAVEAQGPIGWQLVQANYTTYGWRRNIDKLDESQRRLLAGLIESAKSGRLASPARDQR